MGVCKLKTLLLLIVTAFVADADTIGFAVVRKPLTDAQKKAIVTARAKVDKAQAEYDKVIADIARQGGAVPLDKTITWNPTVGQLAWRHTIDGVTKHVINFGTRQMTANSAEAKEFPMDEKMALEKFFYILENYIMESEAWYENPEGFMRQHENKSIEKQQDPRASSDTGATTAAEARAELDKYR